MMRLCRAVADRFRQVAATPDAGSSTAQLTLATPLLVAILLFVVMCGRLVSAQIDVAAAASSGARSASLLGHGGGVAEAERNARATLAAHGATCRQASVSVSGDQRPGGSVTVRVSCRVKLSDLLMLGIPGSRTVEASATSPVDKWAGS